jgi:flavorubredoxin
MLTTNIHEIADGVFRLSTCVPEVAPGGFTFNQFLIAGDEPTLFHTGPRGMFPLVSEAVGRVLPLASLRWISFGHVEADESGAMNLFLDAAPGSEVAFNPLGCDISLNDLCDRPPVAGPTARTTTPAATCCGCSPHRTSPTAGSPRSCGTPPPARSSAGT